MPPVNTRFLIALSMLALLSGCETLQTPQQRQQSARQQAASRYTEERVKVLQGQVQSIEAENGRLTQEVRLLREAISAYNGQLSQLNSNMQALESKQAREMQELIKRVEKLLSKAVASRPAASSSSSSHRGAGYEHVVEARQTLSVIAQAYGTTVPAIKKANNLKSDTIYVGQKLFIPE